ncbi:MAG TPA: PPC domain-containing DNA-binding protein [Acidobacteriota bacterium]|nr:PPC domain-containing DNA-binding protein [Acidobacteriota bacterium]
MVRTYNLKLRASEARCYALRLKPEEDLVQGIRTFVNRHRLRAVAVVTCVGSVMRAKLRFANVETWAEKSGPFEILSLSGIIDEHSEHLHIGLADSEGRCIGGHIGLGSTIYTTAEIVLAELVGLEFRRTPCPLSGYEELIVQPRQCDPDEERDET